MYNSWGADLADMQLIYKSINLIKYLNFYDVLSKFSVNAHGLFL